MTDMLAATTSPSPGYAGTKDGGLEALGCAAAPAKDDVAPRKGTRNRDDR